MDTGITEVEYGRGGSIRPSGHCIDVHYGALHFINQVFEFHSIALFALHSIYLLLYYDALDFVDLYFSARFVFVCIALHCIILNYIALHYITLYCIALH